MTGPGTIFLLYHELRLPSRPLCANGKGYTRYIVNESDFRAQLLYLKESHFRAVSVGEALQDLGARRRVVITFDDGCETDLIAAAPLLKESASTATFYIVTGWVGRRGYLSVGQVRELSKLKFEIGCHSMTHAYLDELNPAQLHAEIMGSKDGLEQFIGCRVDHFSCPGGRWTRRLADMARLAGYQSVVTSQIGENSPTANRFRLARVGIMSGTRPAEFNRVCRGEGLFVRRAQAAFLSGARSVLGNAKYEKLRSAILR